MSDSHRIALLIPTRNRRKDLTRLMESLAKQTRQPDYIYIIDGGEEKVEDFVERYSNLPVSYQHVYPPGLTKQRNVGLKGLAKGITLVGFLDDDLELFPDALEKMLEFWEKASAEFGGASFNIVNNYVSHASFLHRLFLINNGRGGTILKSGNNVILHPVLKDTETQWLSGGATVWRAEVFEHQNFEERYKGYGLLDDLDFCLSLRNLYRFIVLKDAKVYHHTHPVKAEKMRDYGEYDVVCRYMFVNRFHLSRPAFFWSAFGRILAYSVSGIVKFNRGRINFARGYLQGIFQIIRGTQKLKSQDIK